MNIIISNSSGKPIYEQITAQIKGQIMNGSLKPGEALPSMRLLAKEPVSYTHLTLPTNLFV